MPTHPSLTLRHRYRGENDTYSLTAGLKAVVPLAAMTEVPSLPFAEVYRSYADDVYRFCISLAHDAQLAEDLCGDVFVAAMRAYDRRRPTADELKPWLFRIARNTVIDHVRRQSVWRRIAEHLQRSALSSETVENVVSRHDDLRRASDAMRKLRRKDRELIGLRTGAELSYSQIGAVMGMSEDGARVATGRALAQLRRLMEGAP